MTMRRTGHAQVLLKGRPRCRSRNLFAWRRGAAFEIAQGRSRALAASITACATIGVAEVALEKMIQRLTSRVAFGKQAHHPAFGVGRQRIAEARHRHRGAPGF